MELSVQSRRIAHWFTNQKRLFIVAFFNAKPLLWPTQAGEAASLCHPLSSQDGQKSTKPTTIRPEKERPCFVDDPLLLPLSNSRLVLTSTKVKGGP
uniref:Uncharacterized protein n=1 Tax=Utricularia reniformis TaxID=192314 RepID=A0A1Y0B0B8_9LAMI|nr:hypothetical protein AEK19_MT0587 [Utricularia reniformis]ART30843.1 hypothetical protein AEK19_MT0587 [Utricularia reniformis]